MVDQLKKEYFANTKSFFGKQPKTYTNPNLRNITAVFSSIASNPTYSEIRKRYKIHHTIKLGLSKTHLGFIVYVAYKEPVLTIMATNHIGQSELEYQKMALLKHLKRYKDFSKIEKISILRYDMVKRSQREQYFDVNKVQKVKRTPKLQEQSYGIFENNISDKNLHKKIEQLRDVIKQKRQST